MFIWTVRDIIGLAILGIGALVITGMFAHAFYQDWREHKRNRRWL